MVFVQFHKICITVNMETKEDKYMAKVRYKSLSIGYNNYTEHATIVYVCMYICMFVWMYAY